MDNMSPSKQSRLKRPNLIVPIDAARKHAQLHLFLGVAANSQGVVDWSQGRLGTRPIKVFDLSGIPLFYDFPIYRGRKSAGFVRTAATKVLGEPVISSQISAPGWNIKTARAAFQKLIKDKYPSYSSKRMRLVCYSYPKLAFSTEITSREGETKTLLMDVGDLKEIKRDFVNQDEESGQVIYSLLDRLPEKQMSEGPQIWDTIDRHVDDLLNTKELLDVATIYAIRPLERAEVITRVLTDLQIIQLELVTERIIDFCCHTIGCRDHECFCPHPQENNVHCTRASSQMILCYWRYCFSQHDIAQAFGVTDTDLTPWSAVASGLESLTNKCFDANLDYSVTWHKCVNEISNRRPFLSDTGMCGNSTVEYLDHPIASAAFSLYL